MTKQKFAWVAQLVEHSPEEGRVRSSILRPGTHTFRIIASNQAYMYYVYILKSKKDEKLYIGSTNDLKRRLSEHNKRQVSSTKSRAPFELRYYESFYKENDARKREVSLKKDGKALGQLRRRISESLL